MKYIVLFVSALGIIRGFMFFCSAYKQEKNIQFRPFDIIVRGLPDEQKSRAAIIVEAIFCFVISFWLLISFL